MAGTATNYDSEKILVDRIAQIWVNVAIPSGGARLTLDTDGTPDATANPSAQHLGLTKEGAVITIVGSLTKHFADELETPVKATTDTTEMMFEGTFLQVADLKVLESVTQTIGTKVTASGIESFTIGRKTLTYTPVALIWPTAADATKFHVAQMYAGINEAGLSHSISRKGMAEIPFKFVAYGIASRAAADRVGNYWRQVAP
jgi:hypothetical protein